MGPEKNIAEVIIRTKFIKKFCCGGTARSGKEIFSVAQAKKRMLDARDRNERRKGGGYGAKERWEIHTRGEKLLFHYRSTFFFLFEQTPLWVDGKGGKVLGRFCVPKK